MKTYKVDNRYWFNKYYFIEQFFYYKPCSYKPFIRWYLNVYIPIVENDNSKIKV